MKKLYKKFIYNHTTIDKVFENMCACRPAETVQDETARLLQVCQQTGSDPVYLSNAIKEMADYDARVTEEKKNKLEKLLRLS